jgi:hypothetical protein
VTGHLSGHLRVLLALGTEDQVQFLEVTRGLKEVAFTPSSQDFHDPMQAACYNSNSIQTSIGGPLSLEPHSVTNRHKAFSYPAVNHHEPSLLGQSEPQIRHIRNNLSEVPHSLYDRTHALESFKLHCYHNSDGIHTLDTPEDVTSLSVDASDLTGSLPSVTSVLHRTVLQEGKIDVEYQGNSYADVARHMSSKSGETEKRNAEKPCSSPSEGSVVSLECPTVRREKYTQEPNLHGVPTLDIPEDVTSLSVDVSDVTGSLPSITSVLHRTVLQEGKIDGVEFQGNSYVDVARHMSSKSGETEKSNAQKPCSSPSEGSVVSLECLTVRREKYTQEPNLQFTTHMVTASHCDVESLGTKEFSQSIVDGQVKPSPRDQSSQAGAGPKTLGTGNSKIGSCLSSDKRTDTEITSKHQESQTDIHGLNSTISGTVTLQNSFDTTKGKKCELTRSPAGDVFCEACTSSNDTRNVQDLSDSKNSSFLQNERIKVSVGHKESSCKCTQTPLSPVFAQPNTTLESRVGPYMSEPCSESPRPGLIADGFPGIVNQPSTTEKSSSQPAEVEPEDRFRAHLDIERALHLQCFTGHDDSAAVTGTAFETSTYIGVVLTQGCPSTESELKMFTAIVPRTTSPVWQWQCDTWLPSDLLTNVSIIIMKYRCALVSTGNTFQDVLRLHHNPSGRSMALGSTQPLTEMSTRNISWG